MYKIEFLESVLKKDLGKLSSPVKSQVHKAICSKLPIDPYLYGKPLQFAYKGHRRLRVSDYRIIYKIDEPKKVVYIVRVSHRKDIYDI